MSFPDTEPRANILVAYPYWSAGSAKHVAAGGDRVRLVIDSGAFTAWKAGKPIALDDYCKFIEELSPTPWRYFTLDVVGDAKATLANYETMLKRGFEPVPIFTRGEDPSVLEDYYATSDLVGVGGLVGTRNNKGFVNGIMKRIGDRKVHWLGFTNIDYIKFYRPYMCDSSSWEAGARYASVKLYMGNGRYVSIKKADFIKQPPEDVLERIRFLGFDPYVLRKDTAWRGGEGVTRQLSAASSQVLSLDIQRNLGTLYFNAIGQSFIAISFFVRALDTQLAGARDAA